MVKTAILDEFNGYLDRVGEDSERSVLNLEKFLNQILNDITQSVLENSNEEDSLVVVSGDGGFVNLLDVKRNIDILNERNKLLNYLKLEYDSIEKFIRLIISKDVLEEYGDLEIRSGEIHRLEEENVTVNNEYQESMNEFIQYKDEMMNINKEIMERQMQINEVHLVGSDLLNDCEGLLKEIEEQGMNDNSQFADDDIIAGDNVDDNVDPVELTYQEWENFKDVKEENRILKQCIRDIERQINEIKDRRQDISNREEENNLQIIGETLKKIIEFIEDKILKDKEKLEIDVKKNEIIYNGKEKMTIIKLQPKSKTIIDVKVFDVNNESSKIVYNNEESINLKRLYLGTNRLYSLLSSE